ncbi:MAG TPA: hypothetical protein VFB78_12585 [Acidimicrobiales bacterium]|nr:hypothetical protein [Acidimicrobiales bacterium]
MSADHGAGYRRRIRLVATDDHTVVGDLEDDFHRFRVTLVHDGERVVTLAGEAIRHPWSACPEAKELLTRFHGDELFARCTALATHDNPKAHCTHMFDLTSLVIPHARRGDTVRQYDAFIPEFVDRVSHPTLHRDGDLVIEWHTERGTITAPEPFAGISMTSGFVRWVEDTLDDDTAEAAMILRRAWDIARGRGRDLDHMATAAELAPFLPPAPCFTFQPEVVDRSRRMVGTARDFSDRPDDLLSD